MGILLRVQQRTFQSFNASVIALISSGTGSNWSRQHLQMLYSFCAGNGIKIGCELAVMCSDDIEPELIPRVTAVTNTPRALGIAAWEIMQETMQYKVCCQTTSLRIITGETVPVMVPRMRTN